MSEGWEFIKEHCRIREARKLNAHAAPYPSMLSILLHVAEREGLAVVTWRGTPEYPKATWESYYLTDAGLALAKLYEL